MGLAIPRRTASTPAMSVVATAPRPGRSTARRPSAGAMELGFFKVDPPGSTIFVTTSFSGEGRRRKPALPTGMLAGARPDGYDAPDGGARPAATTPRVARRAEAAARVRLDGRLHRALRAERLPRRHLRPVPRPEPPGHGPPPRHRARERRGGDPRPRTSCAGPPHHPRPASRPAIPGWGFEFGELTRESRALVDLVVGTQERRRRARDEPPVPADVDPASLRRAPARPQPAPPREATAPAPVPLAAAPAASGPGPAPARPRPGRGRPGPSSGSTSGPPTPASRSPRRGKARVLASKQGYRTLPSVVAYDAAGTAARRPAARRRRWS